MPVNVGTGGRDTGQITVASGNGTIKLRAADGASRAALNIGTGGATTGVAMGAGVTGNVIDFLLLTSRSQRGLAGQRAQHRHSVPLQLLIQTISALTPAHWT